MTNPTPDIVERLREQRHPLDMDYDARMNADWEGGYAGMVDLSREAADEIERLRAQLETELSWPKVEINDENNALKQENFSLRNELAASEDRAKRALRLLRDKSQLSISSHFNHAVGIAKGDISGTDDDR